MKGKMMKKIIAAAMGASMGISAICPMAAVNAETDETGKVVYSTDFEDGDVSYFSKRGDDDTTEISSSDEYAVSGSKSLLASGRTNDWNGPSFNLSQVCEPYTEYYISLKFRGRYYTNATVSMQYTDTEGTDHYSNLKKDISSSDWVTVENLKVSFTDEMKNVSVYLEGGQDDIFIDDFTITEVPDVEIEKDLVSINDAFANDFKVGTALTPSDLSSKPFMALVEKHFDSSITVGNEMKPDSVLQKKACQDYFAETGDDTTPQISFSAASPVLNYCKKNNIPVRIHTLVWHSQTPDWFFKEGYEDDGEWVSKEKMLERMENYIKTYFETLTKLYPDVNFYACDVVNEAWLEDGKPRQPGEQGSGGSEKSAWVQVFGDNSFIESAFTFARKYAPEGCKLYYNDYNEYMDGKLNAIVEMAKNLKSKNLIDGIGMQSHLDARQSLDASFPSVNAYNNALNKYSELGLDIQVTELDATTPENPTENDFKVQADYYKGIWDSIYAHKDHISAVIWWGVTDPVSWRAKQSPLLFDGDYKAKPAYYSIMDGVKAPDVTSTDPTASNDVKASMYGDANENGRVEIADAVLIMQAVSNADEYGVGGKNEHALTPQGKANGDCYDPGSDLTSMDSLAIQKRLVNLIPELPEYSPKG